MMLRNDKVYYQDSVIIPACFAGYDFAAVDNGRVPGKREQKRTGL